MTETALFGYMVLLLPEYEADIQTAQGLHGEGRGREERHRGEEATTHRLWTFWKRQN